MSWFEAAWRSAGDACDAVESVNQSSCPTERPRRRLTSTRAPASRHDVVLWFCGSVASLHNATEPQNHRTTEPQNHRTTELQNYRITELQNHRTTEPL
ncbi:hypothetical protein EYF80_056586 [Liparis tanakae]|uniref:Uncharacterized protein n=1 Tax=Liparis tanakae TaxID=230148 RepID=A0A4Z2EWB9_9TELE|nr:hypothetical protein EYF80_056586 [Liparis tanakae]